MHNLTGLTILICTYNGVARLPETLRYAAAQQVPPGIGWEVLVVSNASTDDTLTITPRLWAALGAPAPLRVLDEAKPGKENALMQGFAVSAYPYVAIVDDDNWLEPDYIAQAVATMEQHPKIGVLGATAEGAFEVTPPTWFRQFEAVYAVGAPAELSGPLRQVNAYVAGAGSVVRLAGWQQLLAAGFAFTTSAQRGAVLSGAEDLELGNALRLAGYELWYNEHLRFRHYMYKERLNWAYLRRIGRSTATSGMASIVYYFLLSEPTLTAAEFSKRYYRWVAWQLKEILRQPKRFSTYWFYRHDDTHPETFEMMRQLHRLRNALTSHAEALRIFSLVKTLQKRLQANTADLPGVSSLT
ncbi:MAG: glycosyltransferase family 2 protein [Hymenobacter sp.]|nr:MAG: glycosyltransferase family 2 protein [Hymenobacter sp.]